MSNKGQVKRVNIPRSVKDPHYRYSMPAIEAKVARRCCFFWRSSPRPAHAETRGGGGGTVGASAMCRARLGFSRVSHISPRAAQVEGSGNGIKTKIPNLAGAEAGACCAGASRGRRTQTLPRTCTARRATFSRCSGSSWAPSPSRTTTPTRTL